MTHSTDFRETFILYKEATSVGELPSMLNIFCICLPDAVSHPPHPSLCSGGIFPLTALSSFFLLWLCCPSLQCKEWVYRSALLSQILHNQRLPVEKATDPIMLCSLMAKAICLVPGIVSLPLLLSSTGDNSGCH